MSGKQSAYHPGKLSAYDYGHTTVYAAQADPRFAWCAYVPEDYRESGEQRYQLVVAVHGTGRFMTLYRDSLAGFAERHKAIILAPLFPAGITGPRDYSSYKFIRAGDLHYDAILLSMVDAQNTASPATASPCSASPAAAISATASSTCTRRSCQRCRSVPLVSSPCSTMAMTSGSACAISPRCSASRSISRPCGACPCTW